jgi:predicted dehydrogenase
MDHNSSPQLRLGVIGAGGFAAFAIPHLLASQSIVIDCVSDVDQGRARALADQYSARNISIDALLESEDVDIVYIATPPSSHAPLAVRALRVGKHVLCEKPLSTNVEDADELVALSKEHNRFAVANLLQRYNPLAIAVAKVIRTGALGAPIHATLENWASDENLPVTHWFWDTEQSGGIFIEHGVHFFDLFASWFGPGTIASSERSVRTLSGIEEQVRCTVMYPGGVMATMYHAFLQPARLERTQIRILFERGHITLYGWIPTSFRLEGLVDDETEAQCYALFTDSRIERADDISGLAISGRHQSFTVTKHLVLVGGDERASTKEERYGDLVHRLFADQLAWVRDPNHSRIVDEVLSRDAVALAVAASGMAKPDETLTTNHD